LLLLSWQICTLSVLLFTSVSYPVISNTAAPPDLSAVSLHDALPISTRFGAEVTWFTVDTKIVDTGSLINFNPSVTERLKLIREPDRKSTRLNSSHVSITYAVFCLNKKQQNSLS